MSRPVTAAMAVQCVELLQLPPLKKETLRKWAERGHVRKLGLDQYGLQKYDLDDIIRMVSTSTLSASA